MQASCSRPCSCSSSNTRKSLVPFCHSVIAFCAHWLSSVTLSLFSDPNLPYDATWTAHQPRAHWYLDFNYTAWTELRSPGVLKRDYRYEQVAFWNNFIPSVSSH